MKHTHRIRRLLVAILAMALLASALSIPSFAANEKVFYTLQVEPGKQNPEIGSIFYVSLKLRSSRTGAEPFNMPIVRFNLHYDPTFYEPLGYNGAGNKLSKTDTASGLKSYDRFNGLEIGDEEDGNFTIIDLSNKPDKYPTSGAEDLDMLAIQWIGPVKNNWTDVVNVQGDGPDGDGFGYEILRVRFRVKETAPLDGSAGRFAIFKNYALGNDTMPFDFHILPDPSQGGIENYLDYTFTGNSVYDVNFPIDVSLADISLVPRPHSPTLAKVTGAPIDIIDFKAEFGETVAARYDYDGIIYGFPDKMTQAGTKTTWVDPQYAAGSGPEANWLYAEQINDYLKTTNGGVLQVSNAGKPGQEHIWDYGTGTKVTLYDAAKSNTYGTYYFVVFGDLDGNFIITPDDYVELKAMVNGLRDGSFKLPDTAASDDPYDSPYHMAACVVDPTNGLPLGDAELTRLYLASLGFSPAIQQHPAMPVAS